MPWPSPNENAHVHALKRDDAVPQEEDFPREHGAQKKLRTLRCCTPGVAVGFLMVEDRAEGLP
jgi:hypothetical protein